MRIKIIILLLVCFQFSIIPQTLPAVDSLITIYKNSAELSQASWGLYARFADDTLPLIDYNSKLKLAPASNMKILTTAAVMHRFGPDYRFRTEVGYDGEIRNGEITGNMIIKGSGDPSFASDRFEDCPDLDSVISIITEKISAFGIKRISGNIVINTAAFEEHLVPDYWPWIDVGNYYGTGVSTLVVNENLYTLYFKPGNNPADPTEIFGTEPELPGIEFVNYVSTGDTGSGDNAYIYFSPAEKKLIAKGTIPAGVTEFSIKGSLPNPAKFFGELLMRRMIQNGIRFSDTSGVKISIEPASNINQFCVFYSPKLQNIVRLINKRSNNLYTEQMLALLVSLQDSDYTYKSGLSQVNKFLSGNNISSEGADLYDACGLSRNNCVTARMLTDVLAFMTGSPNFQPYFDSFPLAGDENDQGGFKQYGKGTILEKKLHVKSGLINGVRAFTGYLFNPENRLIVFSFIANNYEGSSRQIDEFHKEILISLSESSSISPQK